MFSICVARKKTHMRSSGAHPWIGSHYLSTCSEGDRRPARRRARCFRFSLMRSARIIARENSVARQMDQPNMRGWGGCNPCRSDICQVAVLPAILLALDLSCTRTISLIYAYYQFDLHDALPNGSSYFGKAFRGLLVDLLRRTCSG